MTIVSALCSQAGGLAQPTWVPSRRPRPSRDDAGQGWAQRVGSREVAGRAQCGAWGWWAGGWRRPRMPPQGCHVAGRAPPPGAARPSRPPSQPCTGHICCLRHARAPPPSSVPMETMGGLPLHLASDWFPLEPACSPRALPPEFKALPRGFFPPLLSSGRACQGTQWSGPARPGWHPSVD